MIATFLRSLATLLRKLLSEGRAVHCTEANAQELELLAELPWEPEWKCDDPSADEPPDTSMYPPQTFFGRCPECEYMHVPPAIAEPADIALGWLRASWALLHEFRYDDRGHGDSIKCADEDDVKRAAVCAELAVLATGSWVSMETYPDGREGCNPYDGTIEGARAAWSFVVERLKSYETSPQGAV